MEIRFAENRDVAGILKLLKQVGQVHHQGRPDLFRNNAQKYGASQVIAMLNKPGDPIFVAVEEDKVLGYGFCQTKKHTGDPVLCEISSLYIDDLCVDENCRGRGIGKAIYAQILRYARERKCYNVTLNVWACNPGAIKFYEALGLKPQKISMETVLE